MPVLSNADRDSIRSEMLAEYTRGCEKEVAGETRDAHRHVVDLSVIPTVERYRKGWTGEMRSFALECTFEHGQMSGAESGPSLMITTDHFWDSLAPLVSGWEQRCPHDRLFRESGGMLPSSNKALDQMMDKRAPEECVLLKSLLAERV